jgi:protein-L-isoaspartate(D-aspartate) O-methyltransferase
MVARQLRARGIADERVLDAMQSVPRHAFVPPEKIASAYSDEALAIGEGQTISQPFIVAASVEALSLQGHERVLEIGAGCGYQAAVLSSLAREVIAVEAQPVLASSARERLASLGYTNVQIEEGEASAGWPASAPFDTIIVSAAAPAIPPPLLDQLVEGGRLVIPVGTPERQELIRVVKNEGRTVQRSVCACRFVPLLGRFGFPASPQKVARG